MGMSPSTRRYREQDMRKRTYRAASYKTTGPFAGKVVTHRNVDGPQVWKIVISVVNDEGTLDTHVIRPTAPLYLSELQSTVQRSIDEVCPIGSKIQSACLEFFVESR